MVHQVYTLLLFIRSDTSTQPSLALHRVKRYDWVLPSRMICISFVEQATLWETEIVNNDSSVHRVEHTLWVNYYTLLQLGMMTTLHCEWPIRHVMRTIHIFELKICSSILSNVIFLSKISLCPLMWCFFQFCVKF